MRQGDLHRDPAQRRKIHPAGAQNQVNPVTGQHRGIQGGHNGDCRQGQRKRNQQFVRGDQPPYAADCAGGSLQLFVAHSVLSTSSRLSWLRQISL